MADAVKPAGAAPVGAAPRAPVSSPEGAGEGPHDAAIVARVLRGDRDAYALLVERHQHRIVGHVMRMVRDRDAALEIAHVAFIKAYRNLARYEPSHAFTTWLHAIAGNAAIDHLRARRKGDWSLDEPDEDGELRRELPSPDDSPEELAVGRELAAHLEEAIAKLHPRYRQLLLLRHPGGHSYEEIARATHLPIGTVKARIFRARQQLKDMLGDVLPEDL